MKEILSFLNNMLKINSDFSEVVAIAMEKNEAELVDINTEQMDEGILSTGKKITPEYTPEYAKYKGFKTPNLKLEGDFRSGIFIERKSDYLIYDSTDYKTEKLTTKYSEDIFGTAPKNLQREFDEIDEDIITELDKRYSNGIK